MPDWLKIGAWVAFHDNRGDVLGTVVRVGQRYPEVFLRVVDGHGEHVFQCGRASAFGKLRSLSLLEILAVVSQEQYFENPDLRLCENEDCPKIVDPFKGLYCCTNCALADA